MSKHTVIGFMDEFSPQTTSNTKRMWSRERKPIIKNTSKIRANTFGIFSCKGNSIVTFRDNSKKEDVLAVIAQFVAANPGKRLVIVLDNFSSHRAKVVQDFASSSNIILVYLPPYSPDLNPIEQIWRAIKREISETFIKNFSHLSSIILEAFYDLVTKKSYSEGWVKKYLSKKYYSKMFCT
jgi:putative transposase